MDPEPAPRWAASSGAAAHVFAGELLDTVVVDGPDGHHLATVRRLRVGETVTVSDGAGAWRCYDVTNVGRGSLALAATSGERVDPFLLPQVVVAVALTKGGIDDVVARLTELGVSKIEPLRARRSVARWNEERALRSVARLRKVAREAAMQCRRARIPEVGEAVDLEALRDRRGLLVADRCGMAPGAVPFPPAGEPWTVVVGPEGGLDESEQEILGSATRISVGPHVLRAETAPVAVAAALVARSIVDVRCGAL